MPVPRPQRSEGRYLPWQSWESDWQSGNLIFHTYISDAKFHSCCFLLYVHCTFIVSSVFHIPFPTFHSRYGEYLGLLENPSSSLPHSARLERALIRTRQLLQHQQHTKKKTQLSKCMWTCLKLRTWHTVVFCHLLSVRKAMYMHVYYCCFLFKLFQTVHMC